MNPAKDVHKSNKPTQNFKQTAQNFLNTNPTKKIKTQQNLQQLYNNIKQDQLFETKITAKNNTPQLQNQTKVQIMKIIQPTVPTPKKQLKFKDKYELSFETIKIESNINEEYLIIELNLKILKITKVSAYIKPKSKTNYSFLEKVGKKQPKNTIILIDDNLTQTSQG